MVNVMTNDIYPLSTDPVTVIEEFNGRTRGIVLKNFYFKLISAPSGTEIVDNWPTTGTEATSVQINVRSKQIIHLERDIFAIELIYDCDCKVNLKTNEGSGFSFNGNVSVEFRAKVYDYESGCFLDDVCLCSMSSQVPFYQINGAYYSFIGEGYSPDHFGKTYELGIGGKTYYYDYDNGIFEIRTE